MESRQLHSIDKHFSKLEDPRRDNRRHQLIDIITIAICGVICNADTFDHIAEFGRAKYKFFKKFLMLPHGVPSADTFERVFARIDPDQFKSCFISWVKDISRLTKGEVIAIDGKTLRRSHDRTNGKSAIHMVSAWACANGLVVGQIKTDEKSNEITAIPQLIELLCIEGCIVTIDAMGCQKNIAKTLVENDADYLLALKGNHSDLRDQVALFFQEQLNNDFKDISVDHHRTIDGEHGRIDTREYWTSSDISWLQGREDWQNLQTICMVRRTREFDDKVEHQTSYYISTFESDAKKFARGARGHWGVENRLHWVLDVSFNEDQSRIRKDNAPENFAVLRHIALNMIKKETSLKKSIKAKRLRAGWDDDYLLKVLNS